MQLQDIGFIIASVIIAIIVALFHYMYKAKSKKSGITLFFAFLRFLSVFLLLVLLVNPTFKKHTYYTEKPSLVIAVDNSASIQHLNQSNKAKELLAAIVNHKELQNRFKVDYYSFSDRLVDSLTTRFDQKQTNIANALEELDQIYKNTTAPIVLLTDGNQTYGKEYQFKNTTYKQQIFPIVVGDTMRITDTKIEQLNVNRYAYLKNKFPVEAILTYTGTEAVDTKFLIRSGSKVLHSQTLSLSKENSSKIITVHLPADAAGVQQFSAQLVPIKEEQNTINNLQSFAVEVIDQKTNVVLISDISHPDLGAIKNSIQHNERRSVVIKKPSKINGFDDYQLVILYQPTSNFRGVYAELLKSKKNYLTITGAKTDWSFLNGVQQNYAQERTRQSEYYLPIYNPNYTTFLTENIGFEDFPPLVGAFGETTVKAASDVLLYKRIGAIETKDPLAFTIENEGQREGVLLGEGIWRWRAHSYLASKNFDTFDDFLGKIVQYLASTKKKSRLTTSAASFYYGNASIKIKAAYFTKNYEFDRRGNLQIAVKNKKTGAVQQIPMLLKNNTYESDITNLASGDYEYTVTVQGENIAKSGVFAILDYDVEQQLLNADVTKLKQLATHTEGSAYFVDQSNQLINDLIADQRYLPVQKRRESIVSLIDWKYLLAIIILVLAIEWFIRKYKGLI